MNRYDSFPGEYLLQTLAISLEEEGALRRLLDYAEDQRQGIPAAKAEAIARAIPRCQGGSDDIENLVVCCRRCNSKKGGRTPAQAGMVLQ